MVEGEELGAIALFYRKRSNQCRSPPFSPLFPTQNDDAPRS